MMKNFLQLFLFFIILPPVLSDRPPVALAQEHQGCFMLNPGGSLVNLSEICPFDRPVAATDALTLGTGDIQVTLSWNTVDDLDLYVTDPSGQTVFYGVPQIASGGQLDLDANSGCSEANASPIENIFWPTSQAPTGNYSIVVQLFSRCVESSNDIPFEVQLLVQGNTQTFTGSITDSTPTLTFPFSLPLQPSPQQELPTGS
jgi:hypothetical protein